MEECSQPSQVHSLRLDREEPMVRIPTVAGLLFCRQKAADLAQKIRQRDEAAAVSIIEDTKKAAWLRAEDSGNYPIHDAVQQVILLSCSVSEATCRALESPWALLPVGHGMPC